MFEKSDEKRCPTEIMAKRNSESSDTPGLKSGVLNVGFTVVPACDHC